MSQTIHQHKTELESRVEQRTQELQLTKAAAEAATRAKTEFLANMSHEIRTPMTAIIGYLETLQDAGLSEQERTEAINTVRRNGEHLLGLINDILDISKIESGKMEVEQITCSPVHLLSEVASLMRVRADEKKLSLAVEYSGAIPETIQCDPLRLKQILVNLLGNAIKFTAKGEVRLIARCLVTERPVMQFDVMDTGVGMTAKQAARLFQSFTQADTSTTRQYGGTGLGLSISKRLAEMLGGDIVILDTQPGVGTHCRLTVTAGCLEGVHMFADQNEALASQSISNGPSQTVPIRLDGRVLLVEDGPDNQRLIAHFLKKAGADVTVADNGKLAVDAVLAASDRGSPFDVILMDMQMPVMDGYAATRCLRAEGYSRPIIALTAHAMAADREKCIEAGCNDYATKPIDRQSLIEKIATYGKRTVTTTL